MRCPNDSTDLIVMERQGIDIHSCPICGGVWLERGELDGIIDRAMAAASPVGREPPVIVFDEGSESDRPRRRRDRFDDHDDGEYERPRKGRKRRRGRDLVEDALDF